MLEIYTSKAEECIDKALYHALKIINSNSKTEILNTEYYMGQFSAYMDMIEITDINKYVEVGEKTSRTREIILKQIDKLYR